MNLQPAVLAAAILTAGLTMAPAAQAVTQSRIQDSPGGSSCQLSVPTTASAVRPRATGYRNEGTTNAFVICQTDSSTGNLTDVYALLTAFDGTVKTITCTGVNGVNYAPGLSNILYSSQSVATNSAGGGLVGIYHWDASNFGGTAGNNMPSGGVFSVTCLLPPGSQINLTEVNYNEDVGA